MTEGGAKRYKELNDKYIKLSVKKVKLENEISETLVEMARIEIAPFVQGQNVKCVVPMGRSKKEQVCRLEIDECGKVYVRPYRADGTLCERRFKADPGENRDYSTIFKEVDR